MIKILEFLIKFINETDLCDNIEMTYEPNAENPDVIVIRRVKDHEYDQPMPWAGDDWSGDK